MRGQPRLAPPLQKRRAKPEAPGFYAAVLALRRRGRRVYRAGRETTHVDGRRVPNRQVVSLAQQLRGESDERAP